MYTKPWVVDLILDLVGYTSDKRLFEMVLVEPSAGDGSFLTAAALRLIHSCKVHGVAVSKGAACLIGYEIDPNSVCEARKALVTCLMATGVDLDAAKNLADRWVKCGDFLLESAELAGRVNFVIGNPPYIRHEALEFRGPLYRALYPTMVGRSDIYVAFFEAGLRLLAEQGRCGFICADRWMYNQYGSALRRFITGSFGVETVIQMHDADAFAEQVSAYPAVTVIRRSVQDYVTVATLGSKAEALGGAGIAELLAIVAATGEPLGKLGVRASRLQTWFRGNEPWPLMSPERLKLLKRLERDFPTLESSGATIGIGVATGCDGVFVTRDSSLVEAERLLPIAMAQDAKGSKFEWSGHYLINPWNDDGLVELDHFPLLAKHLNENRAKLSDRHVGKKSPSKWFRTIDRVNPTLATRPKLYLPDFKGRIAPVLDAGQTYPHHNLYYVASDTWDLKVLGGLLLSNVAQFFIESYGVRMRGGYLRFQAQYLRKLRVPYPRSISEAIAGALVTAFEMHDIDAANRIASHLYGLTKEEGQAIGY